MGGKENSLGNNSTPKKKNTNVENGQYVIQQTLAKYKPCTDSINMNRE